MFAPGPLFTRACYVAGYIFLSIISVGFGFGFYWKVLESRGEASRSAESAITQVQTALFAASTRLEQLQSTLDQLTTISSQKAVMERESGKSCPDSGPGDGPRRKMRDEDAGRFKFAADFVRGRIGTVKSDMAGLDGDLQKIVKDDRSVIDAKTGNRNEFLRGVGRKLDLTVTGFNAFRSDPQLKQIRIDLADRAEKTTITGTKGVVISCPDGQLQMALRGVVRAIDQLPELEKPKIAAVEGSEAVIEAFRRLTTTFFGLLSFKLPPSADELRELQRKAVQSVEGGSNPSSGQSGAPALRSAFAEQSGLAKRDYVPLAVAIFVDLCLLLVSIGRPVNQFVGLERGMREAEEGPVYPILSRFHDIHADAQAIRNFDVFRDVIFDFNGQYHVAVPLSIPRDAPDYETLQREAHRLGNLCYALEGKGILAKPISFLPSLVALRELKRRGSKFVACYGRRRPARYQRGWDCGAVHVVGDGRDRAPGLQGLPLQEGRLAGDDPGRRDGRLPPHRSRGRAARRRLRARARRSHRGQRLCHSPAPSAGGQQRRGARALPRGGARLRSLPAPPRRPRTARQRRRASGVRERARSRRRQRRAAHPHWRGPHRPAHGRWRGAANRHRGGTNRRPLRPPPQRRVEQVRSACDARPSPARERHSFVDEPLDAVGEQPEHATGDGGAKHRTHPVDDH